MAIVRAGIDAAMPARLLANTSLDANRGVVRLVAAGKAAEGMARAAVAHLNERPVSGVVIAPSSSRVDPRLESIAASHPVPDKHSERAGRRALETAAACDADDTLLVLLSGGASALMAVPAEGIALAEKRETTSTLLRAGADITALNTVRKHLSAIKGGWLAAQCRGTTRALAISDVVGDDLSVIGSGPTVADATTFGDALDVLERFGGTRMYPPAVVQHLARGAAGEIADTPKPGDPRLARCTTAVVGGRGEAMTGAAGEAAARGYQVTIIAEAIVGVAAVAGRQLVRRSIDSPRTGPACVVASGETTVVVRGSGRGGRNQELALGAAVELAALGAPSAFASAGTDGIDGPTDAAGAMADETTLRRAAATGLPDSDHVLASNDAYPFFAALGDLIHTGATGTNVGDLQVLLLP